MGDHTAMGDIPLANKKGRKRGTGEDIRRIKETANSDKNWGPGDTR